MDQQGRRVLLRGLNDDALLDYRNAEPARPSPLDEADASLMHQAGFDEAALPAPSPAGAL